MIPTALIAANKEAAKQILVCISRNDVPLEYSNEEQAICAVGLMKPKFGVFPEAVQYVLVICTASEVHARIPPQNRTMLSLAPVATCLVMLSVGHHTR